VRLHLHGDGDAASSPAARVAISVRIEGEGSVVGSENEVVVPWRARYYEIDGQGVVYNGWYLVWFDEAMSAFLTSRGLLTSAGKVKDGFQLVHAEVDWKSSVRLRDCVEIVVRPLSIGTTSFRMGFTVRRNGEVACTASIVYVCIVPDGSAKRPVPEAYREAFG
jgi:acyl-CoA thioester hydrolase